MDDADVIVVGFRVAGAPLAHALCRAGLRVIALERDAFFTDQPISTHAIQPYGMRMFDEIELGDVVRDLAPFNPAFRFQIEDDILQLDMRGTDFDSRSPRRCKLDPALQRAALEVGVDGREHSAVVGLLTDGDRVCGVRVKNGDREYELRAPLVVGADGRNSTIAQLVRAPAYLESTTDAGIYWSYIERPPLFDEDARFDWGACIHIEGDEARAVFQTDSNLLLVAGGALRDRVRTWKRDPAEHLRAHLEAGALTGPLIDGADFVEKPIGLLSMQFFMKQAVGPGWALVGDAGLHINPTPGLGITDAVRDAVALAKAIVRGGQQAMELYWRQRDVDSVALYHFAGDMGSPEFNNQLNRMLFRRTMRSPAAKKRMARMMDRELRPVEMFPPLDVVRWLVAETFSGNAAPWRDVRRSFAIGQLIDRQQAVLDRALARTESGDLSYALPSLQ